MIMSAIVWSALVSSHQNPADLATRSVDAQNLSSSMWHHGPTFLHHQEASVNTNASLASETAEDDPEVRPVVQVLATQILPDKPLGTSHFCRFSQWATLVRAIGRLLSFVHSYRQKFLENSSTTEVIKQTPSACLLNRGKFLIIQIIRREA